MSTPPNNPKRVHLTCAQVRGHISDYVRGILQDPVVIYLEEHLIDCDECPVLVALAFARHPIKVKISTPDS